MNDTLLISLTTVILSAISALTLTNWRLKEIEKRLDVHNGYAEKFAATSTDIACIQKDIEYIKNRIDND